MAAILDVRKDEAGKVKLICAMLALLAMGYAIGWSAIHAMMVKRLGLSALPYSYIGISLLGLAGSSIYLMFADRVPRVPLLVGFSTLTGVALVAARMLVPSSEEFALVLAAVQAASGAGQAAPYASGHAGLGALDWLSVQHAVEKSDVVPIPPTAAVLCFFVLVFAAQGLGNSTLVTQVWTVATDVFRPSQGHRLFPILAVASTAGGIAGGIAIQGLVDVIGSANLVLIWAGSVGAVVPLSLAFRRRYGGELRGVQRAARDKGRWQSLAEGFRFVAESRFLCVLSLVALFFWVVGSLQDFQYTHIMNQTFTGEDRLNSFYGIYAIVFNLTALLLQVAVTGRLLARVGIGWGLVALPLTGLCGFLLIGMKFSFLPGLLLRYSWDVVGMTLQGTAVNLGFLAVSGPRRGQVRGFIEGIVNPLGGVLGGLLVLFLRHAAPGGNAYLVTLAGLAGCALWIAVVRAASSLYLREVSHNLSSPPDRRTFLESIEALQAAVRDPLVQERLAAYLAGDDREAKVTAMRTMGQIGELSSLRAITPFTSCPDEELRAEAVRSIRLFRGIGREPVLAFYYRRLLERLLAEDPSYTVRAEAARCLIEHHNPRDLPPFLRRLLTHAEAPVRAQAVEAVARIGLEFGDFLLEEVLSDPDPEVRARALIVLWPVRQRRKSLDALLRTMLKDERPAERQAGLLVVVRAPHTAMAPYLEEAEGLLHSPDLRTRTLAALAYLAAGGAKTENGSGPPRDQAQEMQKRADRVGQAVQVVLGVLGDAGVPEAARREVADLLPELPEEGLDEVLVAGVQLPAPTRALIQGALRDFPRRFLGTPGLETMTP